MRSAQTVQPSAHHDRWRQILSDSYLVPNSSPDSWPPLKAIQFVQIALIQQEERARHIGLKTVCQSIDETCCHKITNIHDLFTNLKHSSLYLLEGRPGCGKTTLMLYISQEWAKENLLKSELVLLIPLRKLGNKKDVCLRDLLQVACCDLSTKDIKHLASYIKEKRGEGILFAMDGFDEYAPGVSTEDIISRIITKTLFCRSIVIVSSRPAATQPLRRIAIKWIEVLGFTNHQVVQYINCYFEKNKEKSQLLANYLKQHPRLMNLCYLPLHCAMLVSRYEEDSTLPKTESEFCRDLILSTLVRCICKNTGGVEPPPKLTSFDKLPPENRVYFDKICKLAFKATINSQLVFEKSELDVCFSCGAKNDKGSLDLFVIDRYFVNHGFNENYTFVHLILQEYLTAIFIAGLSESDQKDIVTTHCHQKHLIVTWRFLFGILDYSKESTVNLFKLILDATPDDHLFHVQCAYESQHCSTSACTDTLQFHTNKLEFNNVSSSDLTCITYVLKTAEYTTIKLSFSSCDFTRNETVAFLEAVGDHQLALMIE